MADKPMRVELKGGPGTHQTDLLIDGVRPDWWIEGITIKADGGDVVKAIITVALTTVDVSVDVVDGLEVEENVARALKALGWTTPVGGA